jgi:hypothetical protein
VPYGDIENGGIVAGQHGCRDLEAGDVKQGDYACAKRNRI